MNRTPCIRAIAVLGFYAWSASSQGLIYTIDSIAGTDISADAAIQFEDLRGIAVDLQGNVYVSDTSRHRIIRLNANGSTRIIAGTGASGFSGDGGLAEAAELNLPYGIATDAAGNLYVADLGNRRVRCIGSDGRIRTVAGGGTALGLASGTRATDVSLRAPRNVAVDLAGNVYFSDFDDHRVFQIGRDGRIAVIAGTGSPGPAADQTVSALSGTLRNPAGVAVDSTGAVYIADSGNHAIRRVGNGVMTTVRVEQATSYVNLPTGVAVDAAGNLYVASAGFDQVVKVASNGTAAVAISGASRDVATDAGGTLYAAGATQARRLSGGQISNLTGPQPQFRGEGIPANQAVLSSPADVKLDPNGGLILADTGNHRIRRVNSAGVIQTIAGSGDAGFGGDNGAAAAARFSSPQGVAIDRQGVVFVSDTDNHRIRRIEPVGVVSTVAGTGTPAYAAEPRTGILSPLNAPTGLAVDETGAVIICDTGNHAIRKLTTTGFLVTIAGNGRPGFAGDRGGALAAQLNGPRGAAFDREGNLFIADTNNHRIRKISAQGVITTVAGTGVAGFSGDGGPAINATLNQPVSVAVDPTGTLYISDAGNLRIRRVSPDGVIATIAGTGASGRGGDRGPASAAQFDSPAGVAVDGSSALYVADRGNHRIRKIVPSASTQPPTIVVETQVKALHAATLETGPVAPGMLVVLQGPGIGTPVPVSARIGSSGALDTLLGGIEVRFDGRPAPLLYAQENMIHVQVPYRVASQTTTLVEIVRDTQVRQTMTLGVTAVAPGVFTTGSGSGAAAGVNEDGSLNSDGSPAARGTSITFYMTGEGAVTPAAMEGRLSEAPYPTPVLPVQVQIGNATAELLSAQASVSTPGLLQVTVRIPLNAGTGAQSLAVQVGGVSTQRQVIVFVK